MSSATVTSKGQITIPVEVRLTLNLAAGDRVEFVQVESERFEMLAANQSITKLKGMFGKTRKKVSIDDMNRVVVARRERLAADRRSRNPAAGKLPPPALRQVGAHDSNA